MKREIKLLKETLEKLTGKEVILKDLSFTVTKEEIKEIALNNNIDINSYNFNEIVKGLKTELEHGKENPITNITDNDLLETLKIVIAHLNELPDYYTQLETIEKD